MTSWYLRTNNKPVSCMIHMILAGLSHSHDLKVRVINDRLNEVGRSGLTQSVLFHTAAKRKTPASSLSAIPQP